MFNLKIKTNQPFASEFLEAALAPGKERVANAYLLTGSNTMDMYFLALETARILNCEKKIADCTCNNCAWIRQNRHPAVTTISPIDYIHPNKDGKAKTVITINQARSLKQSLAVSSQYHKVIIFTDAKEGKEYESKAELMWQGYREFFSPPALQNNDSQRNNWIPIPLTYKIMHSEPANALLKIIEEPPPRVTFFFLAKDREDMLDTIVSRSQIIPLSYNPENTCETNILEKFFSNFPPKTKEEAILYSEKFLEIAKENSLSLEDLLNIMQKYLVFSLKENSSDNNYCLNNIKWLKSIHMAQIELKSYVNPQAVTDSMFISFSA